MKNKEIFILMFTTLIIGIIIGTSFQETEIRVLKPTDIIQSEIMLVAIDNNDEGVIIPLIVEVRPGNGKVLTDIDKLLFWVDTQFSIQTAKEVAEDVTGIDASNYDITYSIEDENVTIVGGASAGAGLTVATIAALENKTLNENVMITGTINEDGTIGRVGSILEKAKAAKENNADTFLVPRGQGIETYLEPQEECTQTGSITYCETTYKQLFLDIGEDVGIEVIEVNNIRDILKYFN
jgi:uncharacterized protein